MEKCLKCGTEVAPTAKFCGECGAKIERKKYCPACGTEVKPEQKFCTECGTRLIESQTLAPQPKTEPEQSKKKSEPKPDKELDKKLNDLYKMGVACQLGKKGVEQDIMLAMEYYQEYLEEAPTSHSKYLDAHYGMAEICTKMGDEGHSLGMDEDALDWYNEAVEHYEEIVKYPKKPFNNRLLAEVAYDKLRKKIAKLK